MAEKYDSQETEKKWQEVWEKTKLNVTDLDSPKEKFYNLVMFPYPSGESLHMGHGYNYAGADVYGRYKKLTGLNVFQPIGFDSFGLPAENYAISKGVHPRKSIGKNIELSREQLKDFGCIFDFSKELTTSEPNYYKWTQWLFLKLYERGLAYQKESPVNWCPKCMTVLANEQVSEGLCERCETEVIQKEMKQWFFKITDYADRLIEDLDKVDWPESSVTKQRNWIGKSEGVEFEMEVVDQKYKIEVFTTRVDTVYGMTYVVLAPEHPLVSRITTKEHRKEVEDYKIQTQKQTDIERQSLEKEKTGAFTGSYAINPFNGEKVPIWIADYVLYGYGTGAVMAVPAHDERDYEFAKKYGLEIKEVVIPNRIDINNPPVEGKRKSERKNVHALVRDPKTNKYLCLRSKKFKWVTFPMGGIEENENVVDAAKREVEEETGYKNLKLIRILGGQVRAEYFAKHKNENRVAYTKAVLFDLVDNAKSPVEKEWSDEHEMLWIDESEIKYGFMCHAELDVWIKRLKKDEGVYTDYGVLVDSSEFTGLSSEEAKKKMAAWLEKKKIGKTQINYRLHDWSIGRQRYWGAPIPIIYCEKCGVVPVPEKDLPVELPEKIKDFRPKGTGKGPLASVKEFVETTCPKCGGKAERETDTMDTFVCSSFYFLRYPNVGNDKEMMEANVTKKWLPVDMYVGGAEHVTMHLLYARFITKALYDAKMIHFDEPFMKLRHQGMILGPDGKKMSKSKGNVVIPDAVIKEHGADAFRTYILFMGRFEDGGPWEPKGLIGVKRFLEKIWKVSEGKKDGWPDISSTEVQAKLARTIKKVAEDIESYKFNTAISTLMIFANEIQNDSISKEDYEKLLIVLSPFAPFMTEEMWSQLGNKDSIHLEMWPSYDEKLIKEEMVTVAVQINGKVREQLLVSAASEEKEVLDLAKGSEKVKKYLEGKAIKKVIYIKGRLLSIVIG